MTQPLYTLCRISRRIATRCARPSLIAGTSFALTANGHTANPPQTSAAHPPLVATATVQHEDPALLSLSAHDLARITSLPQSFPLGLPIAGRNVLVHIAGVQFRNDQNFTITGSVADVPDSTFVLAREDETWAGGVFTPSASYQLLGSDRVGIKVQEGPIEFADECLARPAPLRAGLQKGIAAHQREANVDSTCAPTIDVMVVYTPRVRTALGSDAAVRAFAYANVAYANITFANSGVEARLRLVHVASVNYIESDSIGIDLDRLQVNGDGHLDIVHSLREQYGADLVALIIDSPQNPCGVAYVMTEPTTAFREYAFSVTQQFCALANFSFAHELAHNLGCEHDWNFPSPGVFPYSHGHSFTGQSGQSWRTMMAITGGIRIPHFSNPTINFDGVPTGVPEHLPNPADNARTINQIAPIASAFVQKYDIDCNNNGVPDSCDIAGGTSADLNENGVPDECDAPPCPARDLHRLAPSPPFAQLSFDRFGNAVSMSNDRIAIGAVWNDDAGNTVGAAYVFARAAAGQGQQWIQEARLLPNDPLIFQHFGQSVAISADGSHVIVGSYRDGFQISDVGSAYVFRRTSSGWTQTAKLLNPDPQQQDWFGYSVGFGGDVDGNLIAIVGTPLDDEAAINGGAVYIYRQSAGGWSAPIKVTAADPQQNARFGWSVAGSLSGDRLIAGAPLADVSVQDAGAAYVFRRLAVDQWIQSARLVAPEPGQSDRCGWSVAIDGDVAVAGAPGDDTFGPRSGAAHIFRLVSAAANQEGSWNHEAILHAATANEQDQFGSSVAIRDSHAVIGAILATVNNVRSGAAFIFHHERGTWTQQARIAPADAAAFDNFGISVSISPDQVHAAAGAYFDDHLGSVDAGTASVFSLDLIAPDCNSNGSSDLCDISNGISHDHNSNGIPDECEMLCVGDVYGPDQIVNVNDLLTVINSWGPCPEPCPGGGCAADITADCIVNVADLLEVIVHWGPCSKE